MTFTFRGGVHIDEMKHTETCAVEKITPPKKVEIPMSQHIGAHAVPAVSVGDKVDIGQVVGNVENGLGCPIHSSVSGTVSEIIEINWSNNQKIRTVVIENDFENRISPDILPFGKPLSEATTEEIIEVVRRAGITGMGGATFPTYAKIQSAIGKVDRIFVNCAECEPYITANHRLILENPKAVIGGLKILMKALSLREGEIAVEDNKMNAVRVLEETLAGDELVKVKVLKTKYPQGDERQLIYALTGKELPAGKLPADVGCVVFNAETCAAVYDAFESGMPLVERILTVDGDCIAHPKNLLVPIGTPYTDLIEYCGGLLKKPKKIISGGPMMGIAQWDIQTPVTKGMSCLLVFSDEVTPRYDQPEVCIRCGRCVAGCPMRLMPNYLAAFAKQGKLEMAEEFDILSCVECGSCSYSCPGHMPIVQLIRAAKADIIGKKRAEAAAKQNSKIEK